MLVTAVNSVGRWKSAANSRFFAARSGAERVYVPILDALRPLQPQQSTADHIEIRQCAGDEEPVGVLRDAAVANLGECEDTLDDADGVLHTCAHSRARAVDDALARRQILVAAPALLREVLRRRGEPFDHFGLTCVGAVAPDVRFSSVKEF